MGGAPPEARRGGKKTNIRDVILAGANGEDAIRFDYLMANAIPFFVFDFTLANLMFQRDKLS